MTDLFEQIAGDDVLNRNFRVVRDNPRAFGGAMRLVNEIFNSTAQIDNDFKIQFQTNGFDARIWELYLMATFQEMGYDLVREHNFPDLQLKSVGGKTIFVEAVTSNPAFNKEIQDKLQIASKLSEEEMTAYLTELRKASLLRTAGALFNKYNKKYWSYDWVKGKPLVLAVEDFHHAFSLNISDSSLVGYLYGIALDWYHDKDGKLVIETSEELEHSDGHKTIPSNFFALTGAEHISAVIFSNSGTISKFNRMAKLKGYSDPQLEIVRIGTCHDHNPEASVPHMFRYVVGKNGPEENWRQGMAVYHNPNALHKLSEKDFPGVLNGFVDQEFYAYVPDFHPYGSNSENYLPK